MRRVKRLFLILSSIVGSLIVCGFEWSFFPVKFDTSFDPIGPFEQHAMDYVVKGTITADRNVSFREKITVNQIGKEPTYYHLSGEKAIFLHNVLSSSFKLPLYDTFNNQGIHCVFEAIDTNGKTLHMFEFNLKPIMRETINVKDHISTYYVVQDIVVDPDDYDDSCSEKIMFDGFIDYFNEDYYYRIDLDDLFISYECLKEYQEDDGYLVFLDYYRIFPYLDNNDLVPNFQIPIQTIKNNGKISLKFKNLMYVNPQTLDMSLVKYDGFVATKYFYLPINKIDLLIDQIFTIRFDEFGYGKSSFSWDMRYLNNRNLIGDCDNSDYCIKGEIV